MRIGELATKAGVSVQSLRFYERQGLLRKPPRTVSGYRDYDRTDLERIAFIKWCQPLGFTLKEVRQLMRLHSALSNLRDAAKSPAGNELQEIICMARRKSADLEKKVNLLRKARRELNSAIRKLETRPKCPAA